MEQKDYQTLSNDYYRIEKVIRYIDDHYQEQPGLEQLARQINLSEYHFQRLFRRWVGVSPKRFLQYITKEHAKALLEENSGLLEATYRTGLSGPGRLHDLFVQCEAVTPGEYKSSGEGLAIRYGVHPSPFGRCLLAVTDRGICGMFFLPERGAGAVLSSWRERWKNANFHENNAETGKLVERVFSRPKKARGNPLPIYLHGTNFQIKVWEALLRVPSGSVVTYQDIAYQIGFPSAARAVGNAVANNSIPVIIPCHRVIRKSGVIGNYRYGSARKKAILGYEFARNELVMET